MKLVTKIINPLNNFWVEDYNEKAKEFFLNLGFKETKYGGFVPSSNLEYTGSAMFGLWSDEEKEKIFGALKSLNDDVKDAYEWNSNISQMNPND